MPELIEQPTGDDIYQAGYPSWRAYRKAYIQQERQKQIAEQQRANTPVGYTERSSSRFSDGPTGVPISKVKWKQEVEREKFQREKVEYEAFLTTGKFATTAGLAAATRLGAIIGVKEEQRQQFLTWLKSPATAEYYGITV